MSDIAHAVLRKFVGWAMLKLHINQTKAENVYFREREVWWAHLGENIGSEQNGKNDLFDRPVLVVKKFSERQLWVLPLTTTPNEGRYLFATSHRVFEKTAKVALSQIRAISSKRLIKKQRTLPDGEYDRVLELLAEILRGK